MTLHLLSVGANYAGESCELPDCALDAENLTLELEPFIKTGKLLTNRKASRKAMIRGVQAGLAKLSRGDGLLCSWSGHGTVDTVGGKTAQAIVSNDMELIYDFELRKLFADRPPGTFVVLLADCCHSGGLTRAFHRGPVRSVESSVCFKRRGVVVPRKLPPPPTAVYLACRATEFAYSTGRGGAMTNAFIESFRERGDRTTLRSLHAAIKRRLPTEDWPQNPKFECKDTKLAQREIRSFASK